MDMKTHVEHHMWVSGTADCVEGFARSIGELIQENGPMLAMQHGVTLVEPPELEDEDECS
jgi:hypothetical protein